AEFFRQYPKAFGVEQRGDVAGEPGAVGPGTTVVQLRKHDPVAVAASVRNLFANVRASEAPNVEADAESRRLLIRGTPQQVSETQQLLKKMGEGAEPDGRSSPKPPSGGGRR